ncbi:pilus assembly protein TadG-related protein [Algicella marina]|uniref:Uncharacterized protein n=1 Tax=Algicella marina TaxID=2683284 RepID=A0A6P1SXN6_9RHOB|nr:pilus assembly protein TadG-related protein [Algicella marina]QHQ33759.1 hypothetical protein GO499_00480 [Algicella marina]
MWFNRLSAKASEEDGSAMIWSLFWSAMFILIGGLAVDGGNAWRMRTMMQATADASAHAAAVALNSGRSTAMAEALRVAEINMPSRFYGNVIQESDIDIGRWNSASGEVDTSAAAPDTVRVTASRTRAKANAQRTFFLTLGFFDFWELRAQSAVQRFSPACVQDGLIAYGVVELSSNNDFEGDICVHGQGGVKMSQHNSFADGVTVGMPDLDSLQVPAGNLDRNPGLATALSEQFLEPRLVNRIGEMISELSDPNSALQPSYMAPYGKRVVSVMAKDFDAGNLDKGTIYLVTCKGNSGLSLRDSAVMEDVVIVTTCKVSFGKNMTLRNVTIATSNTSNQSFSGSAGTRIGYPDNCAEGGGAQLLTAGNVHFAAKMEFHGSQIVAAGDVMLAAQANGIQGTSVQAGGDIKVTSNSAFGLCDGDADQEFTAPYWRLVN